jgi:hypothetical protein
VYVLCGYNIIHYICILFFCRSVQWQSQQQRLWRIRYTRARAQPQIIAVAHANDNKEGGGQVVALLLSRQRRLLPTPMWPTRRSGVRGWHPRAHPIFNEYNNIIIINNNTIIFRIEAVHLDQWWAKYDPRANSGPPRVHRHGLYSIKVSCFYNIIWYSALIQNAFFFHNSDPPLEFLKLCTLKKLAHHWSRSWTWKGGFAYREIGIPTPGGPLSVPNYGAPGHFFFIFYFLCFFVLNVNVIKMLNYTQFGNSLFYWYLVYN